MKQLQTEFRGILLSTIIGMASYSSSVFIPGALNSILMALLAGMVVGNILKIPENFQSGISFTSSKLLELSILFLAFSINYTHIAKIGAMSFSIIAIMIVLVLLFTYYLSNKVKCPGTTGWLVGFGTAICGSSAIAALSPSITKNKDDVGIAMAVVNLFGSIGMIVMPLVLVKMNLSTTQMGLLLGGTLHSVGNVAGSGYTIRLARVALLSPALIFFNYLVNKDNVKNWKEHFRLPWYLWSFIGITILTSFIHFPDTFLGMMDTAGKIILTIAMAAIGLKVSFKKLYQSGRKGILFGLIVFVVEILIVGGLMMFV